MTAATSDSVWNGVSPARDFPPLDRDLSVDVCVVGAGMAGVTAAVLLRRLGKRVALLDSQAVGAQVTGRSNAKVTALHSLIYAQMIDAFGRGTAQAYADGQTAAMHRIAAFVQEREIDCGHEPAPAVTCSRSADDAARMDAEVKAAQALGLPAAHDGGPAAGLPFKVACGVRFNDQAQVNPVAYLRALADEVAENGGHVHQHTRVTGIEDGAPCTVSTAGGATVTADDVVIATNLPIVDPGHFHHKCTPRGHAVVAAVVDEAAAPKAMTLCIDPPTLSLRSAPWPEDGKRLLIAVGESYPVGKGGDTRALFDDLERQVREHFGVSEMAFRWMNEDYDSVDRIPFVGPAGLDVAHLWTATGFSSWGITHGTLAGMELAERLCGRETPFTALLDSLREPGAWPGGAAPPMRAGAEPEAPARPQDLKAGEGGVFDVNGEQAAVHRGDDGRLHAVSAACTHEGCPVSWNTADRTWDCSCHGSIFTADGRVMHGPAMADLSAVAPPDE